MDWHYKNYQISDNNSRLHHDVIYNFLIDAYWCKGIPRNIFDKSLKNSLCFGVYQHESQVGFCRVVTDYATFAYLADLFILPGHRNQGLAKELVQCVLNHPDLQGFRRWLLGTKDAHELYKKFGFTPLKDPELFMELHTPNLYINK